MTTNMLPDGSMPSWLTGCGVKDPGLAKMTKARGQLIRGQTFYGALAMGMEMVPSQDVTWLGTDGEKLYYNPQGVEQLTEPELQGAVAQAVIKVSMLHHVRMQGRDEKTWQRACEAVTIDALRGAGFTLPKNEGFVFPMPDKSAEEAYQLLMIEQQNSQGGQQPQGNNSQGNQPSGGGSQNQGQPGSQPPQAGSQGGNQAGNTGSAGGFGPNQGNPIVQMIAPKDPQAAAQQAQVQTLQAANLAKGMGDGTPEVEFLAAQLREPETPWDALLRDFMERQARNDYSWSRPNRRFQHLGIYMPGMQSREMGEMVIAVDTSGSLSETWLVRFGGEIRGIIQDLKPSRVTVMYCDTKVHRVEEFEAYDEFELRAVGRGGTDFKPVFERVEELGIDPACLLYFTDLKCNRYPKDASYPVLWAACGDNWKRGYGAPPFGEVITLEERGLRLG